MKGRPLTAAALVAKGACREQVVRFRLRFGQLVEVTEAVCVEHAAQFDWNWAAYNLLSAAAWEEYDKVRAPAFARAYIGDI